MEDIKKPAGRPRKVFSTETVTVAPDAPKAKPEIVASSPTKAIVDTVNGKMEIDINRSALGLGQNEKGQWCVYTFNFNPLTQQATLKEVKNETSHSGASTRFKIMAANFLK